MRCERKMFVGFPIPTKKKKKTVIKPLINSAIGIMKRELVTWNLLIIFNY